MIAPVAIALVTAVRRWTEPVCEIAWGVAVNTIIGTILVFVMFWLWNRRKAPALLDIDRANELETARSVFQEDRRKLEEEQRIRLLEEQQKSALSRDEFNRLLAGQNQLLASVIGASRAPLEPATPGSPLTVDAVRAALRDMGHDPGEIEQYLPQCVDLLRMFNIRSTEGLGRFVSDRWTLDNLTEAYRVDLRRPLSARPNLPLVDPIGLCAWGARIHMAPQEFREQALADVRVALGRLRGRGAP